jgi:hypothetical protein
MNALTEAVGVSGLFIGAEVGVIEVMWAAVDVGLLAIIELLPEPVPPEPVSKPQATMPTLSNRLIRTSGKERLRDTICCVLLVHQ